MGVLAADPVISNPTLLTLLDATVRAAEYAASTAYVIGDKIMPGNGRLYQCLTAGTSGATAPAWPTFRSWRQGVQVSDGSVLWSDIGPAYAERYDINAAIRECWLWRAQQLAQKIDISDTSAKLSLSQKYEQAIKQANRYGWRGAV